jgi:hypothetical protein
MTTKANSARPVTLSDETLIRLPANKLWALVVGVGVMVGTLWGFHTSNAAAVDTRIKEAVREVRIERGETLKQYLTREEYREYREQDFKYWDERLDIIMKEIRRN